MNLILALIVATQAFAYNFGEGELIPKEGIPNPLELSESDLRTYNRAGRFHALNYPVAITGALIPYNPIKRILNRKVQTHSVFQEAQGKFDSFDGFLSWLGLHNYPAAEGHGAYFIPFTLTENEIVRGLPDRMGLTLGKNKDGASAMTFSCAACHTSNLFGKVIIGMQNRFPNAHQLYIMGDRTLSLTPTALFKSLTGATRAEAEMYRRTRKNMKFIEARRPQTLGLDTALGHTALSLSHRKLDEVATKSKWRGHFARREKLRFTPPDSKPGTWWNVKYKNKWLLDGAIVSGNPVITNLLWNEIGRGSDLTELESWIDENPRIINELTAAIYASEAPLITDFFPAEKINIQAAKRGQKLYQKLNCTKCHGRYHKNWDQPDAQQMDLVAQLKTFRVEYHEDTPIKDVGTDPHRYKAMQSLMQLNELRISKKYGIKHEVHKGYVPPPLVGIWARWPYFHNNSAPSLCAVLTPGEKRPKKYWAGRPIQKDRDFDWDCNGYPQGDKVPKHWKKSRAYLYRTRKKGMSNKGHSDRILVKDGKMRFTPEERGDLIQFLQTL